MQTERVIRAVGNVPSRQSIISGSTYRTQPIVDQGPKPLLMQPGIDFKDYTVGINKPLPAPTGPQIFDGNSTNVFSSKMPVMLVDSTLTKTNSFTATAQTPTPAAEKILVAAGLTNPAKPILPQPEPLKTPERGNPLILVALALAAYYFLVE